MPPHIGKVLSAQAWLDIVTGRIKPSTTILWAR
jgi:hypothetical protein